MMRLVMAAAFLFISGAAAWSQETLRIATFNIQNFGQTKIKNAPVRKQLAQIVRQFDIVAVQEVSDSGGEVPGLFLKEINSRNRNYALLISVRTGRQPDDKNSQEQYAFYYDTDTVTAVDDGALFDDHRRDYFQREPFTAQFQANASNFTFTITQIHTRPESAVQEIDALFVVYKDVAARYPDERSHVILGDFNGSCSYATPEDLKGLAIRGRGFHWVVPDNADTTVSPNTHCAYDRIVLTTAIKQRFKSWGVAKWFDDHKVSDHWPVWVKLDVSPLQIAGP